MSVGEKISLLILLLIGLIATCVYTHVDKFKQKEFAVRNQDTQVFVDNKPKSIPEIQKEKRADQDSTQTKPKKIKEPKEPPVQARAEEMKEIKEKSTQTESKTKEESQEKIIQIETKVTKKPLLTTNKKYTRVRGDKLIENMSIATQQLQIRINKLIKENPIIFKMASSTITKKSLDAINKIADILNNNPNIKIEVAGHTDATGGKDLNKKISILRAVAVKKELIKLRIVKKRIKARGYADDIPLVKNNPNGHSRINRRVEFNIIEE